MRTTRTHRALTSLLLLAAVAGPAACVAEPDAGDDLGGGGGGKGDDPSGVVRLEATTADEVERSMIEHWGAAVRGCFDAYVATVDADATEVDRALAQAFTARALRTACPDAYPLVGYIDGALDHAGVDALPVDELPPHIGGWGRPWLDQATVDSGRIDLDLVHFEIARDVIRVQDDNARRRERDPAGVHLDDIRLAWPEVRSETTSSSVFLNPIKFPASALTAARRVASMEAMFPLHGTELVASGAAAVTAFAEHPEAADDDERFGPIADLLAARSIRHQLFFSGSAAYFSNQVLVLIDEHGQAWALQRHSNE